MWREGDSTFRLIQFIKKIILCAWRNKHDKIWMGLPVAGEKNTSFLVQKFHSLPMASKPILLLLHTCNVWKFL